MYLCYYNTLCNYSLVVQILKNPKFRFHILVFTNLVQTFTSIHATSFVCENECPSLGQFEKVQIKNIKLHIVTDIKVNINSLFGFRISIFGWGQGLFLLKNETSGRSLSCLCVITIINEVIMLRACVRAWSVMCAHCITFFRPQNDVKLR